MSSEYQAAQDNSSKFPVPPRIARALLSFFLPAALRDPVLGDLEEEFIERLESSGNRVQTCLWYWWQASSSSCQFIWQQRGTGMAYLISVVFFLFMLVLAVATSQFGAWLISPIILLALLPSAIVLGIGATSFQAARLSFLASFSDASDHSADEIRLARKFLNVTGNQFLLVAGVVFFLGSILLLVSLSQNAELLEDPSRYARYGIALLPLFYGMIFKSLFYSAEQKVLWKYGQA